MKNKVEEKEAVTSQAKNSSNKCSIFKLIFVFVLRISYILKKQIKVI